MKITTKAEYSDLLQRGLLGNFLKSYQTLEEFLDSGYQGFLTIRAREKQSPWFVSCVTSERLMSALFDIQDKGGPDDRAFYFQQIPAPETKRKANIEACYLDGKFVAYIETDTTEPVRGIRERAPLYYGLTALSRLKSAISADSMDTLDELWAMYPGAIIECVEFTAPCGEFNKKLIVFEVRNF